MAGQRWFPYPAALEVALSLMIVLQPGGGDLSERKQQEWTFRYYMKFLLRTEALDFEGHLTEHEKLDQILQNSMM